MGSPAPVEQGTAGTRHRGRRRVLTAAVAVVALLGAGCAGSGGDIEVRPATTEAPAVLAAPLTVTGDAVVDSQLLDVARFVEQARGRPFREQVTVELLDDAAFRARLAQVDAPADAAVAAQQQLLEAVGAIPAGYDLVALSHQVNAEAVLGFYDPATGELVVRGELTPFTRIVLAHELTHALDDQWYDLGALSDPETDDDAAYALAALVEGSAQVVEDAYRDSLSAEERGAAAAEQQRDGERMDLATMPPDLYEGLTDVYTDGLAFVQAVLRAGGTAALDAAFASPPASSEQILHPERYRAGDAPITVAAPPAGGTVTASGTLGEAGLLDLLDLGVPPARARTAAEGWGGDHSLVWSSGTGWCLRVDVVTDTSADATELSDALQEWGAERSGSATATPEDRLVRFTACSGTR